MGSFVQIPGVAPASDVTSVPLLICLLGHFRLLHRGQPVSIPCGGKLATLLSCLGTHAHHGVPRPDLVALLWPDNTSTLAYQSLNSLVYSLHKLSGAVLGGAPAVLHEDGYYRLNTAAGVGVDITYFDSWADHGDQHMRAGDVVGAALSYRQSIDFYGGDLAVETDTGSILERERLRTRFLRLLGYLADAQYRVGAYDDCLTTAWCLLRHDPCREDAHRIIMRCYVQRGERAAALHQYRVCVDILQIEFAAAPEAATITLFDQIRLRPQDV